MTRVLIILLLSLALPGASWAQGVACTSTHSYSNGKKHGARQQKPSTGVIGFTSTATGCLELCKQQRIQYAQKGKVLFGKMQFSCEYNGKMLNQTNQILH